MIAYAFLPSKGEWKRGLEQKQTNWRPDIQKLVLGNEHTVRHGARERVCLDMSFHKVVEFIRARVYLPPGVVVKSCDESVVEGGSESGMEGLDNKQ